MQAVRFVPVAFSRIGDDQVVGCDQTPPPLVSKVLVYNEAHRTTSSSEELKTYLFSYSYEGARWSFEIKARDPDEARERLNRLAFANYDGEVMANIPCPGMLGRLTANLKNALLPDRV